MAFPILQFGTSRFLQAHFDLFVDQGYAEGPGKGQIAVVQTTSSPDSARRLAFFDTGQPYTVRVRGLDGEKLVDQEVSVASIGRGVDANANWAEVERLFVDEARWIVSNTGDRFRNPGGIAREEIVVFWRSQESNDPEFDDEIVDDLLRLLLGNGSTGKITREVNV